MNKTGNYLPINLADKAVAEFFENSDIIVSNIPGPQKEFTILDKRVISLSAFANLLQSISMFILPQTFNGQFRMTIVAKDNLKLDVKQFMDIFMENLQNDVNSFCK